MDELRGFHTAFRACFTRQEPRDQFFNSMVGQFSPLARKSIEPMALQVEGGKVRAMQRLVSEALGLCEERMSRGEPFWRVEIFQTYAGKTASSRR